MEGYLGFQPHQSSEAAAKGACMVFLEYGCCVLFWTSLFNFIHPL